MKFKFVLLFFFSVHILFGQQDTVHKNSMELTTDKLKVGVVLSGGGAKGLAHIGALQVIEEAGVQIDYIAGTSMGAIIGGLYAAGYSPKQLDSIFYATDFNKLIRDELPRNAKTYFERKEDEKYGLSLNFDNFKPSLPSGLSKGQNVYNFLAQLTAHVETNEFKDLPIPFFCVATNLETGAEIIMDQGSLPLAISASGAIPSVFRPIQVEEELLTDGGVVNNFPVEELKKRGANFIIGVDVQDSLYTREKLKNGLDVMTQVSNFRMINAMKNKRELVDVFIRPDIKEFSVLDFDRGEEIIKNGVFAASKQIASLQKIAKQQKHTTTYRKPIHAKDSLTVNNINISGNTLYPRSYILGKIQLNENLQTSYKDFNNGLNNLSATQNFDRIHYQIEKDEIGNTKLKLDVTESKVKRLLRFGVHYDDLYKSALLVNFTQKGLLFNNDIASIDFVLGDNFRYNFDYYIDKGKYWSIGLRSRFNRFENNVDFSFVQDVIGNTFEEFNVNKIQLLNQDFTNQIYVETLWLNQFQFGLGLEQKLLRAKTETILANTEDQEDELETVIEEFNLLSAFGYINFDTLDHGYYPTKGIRFYTDMHIYLTSILKSNTISQFSIVKGQIDYAFPIANRLSLKIGTEMGLRIGNETLAGLNFFLGGFGNRPINNFRPFYGYDFISLSGNAYIKGSFDVFYNFYKEHYLIFSGNYANVGNDLFNSTESWLTTPNFSGYALGYGLDTFIGPLDLKYSYSPEVDSFLWFISLGHRF
ncbi:patatin-like phospholipase family protein [Psychroflexus salis]|uniref:Patatin n=1 Tax=Psychroflexus salis TaxID=1526574 RepID=A0A916ZM44_9FLAO|nr:patatin-like phospholipase family protein [Psychroflexus salis]GGE03560.1 patatin [Psychroflexus salis]